MTRPRRWALAVATGCVAALAARHVPAQSRTIVVMLGTGTPRPSPDRSGPATAVVVNDTPYLVDAGPGIVRRAQAAVDKGIAALAMPNLTTLFLTHLHSDHTVGYPDLIFTTWVQGRSQPLKVFGPAGTEAMTRHILEAWQIDIDIRTNGLEQRSRSGVEIRAHDAQPGVVFKDANVTVTAFPVPHGELPQAFGYKFQSADRTVVISGDTSPGAALIDACRRCDILIHEAFSERFQPADMPNWKAYRPRYHTTPQQLAEIANKTQPALLVVYHHGAGPDDQYLSEIRAAYAGKVAIARDLDVY